MISSLSNLHIGVSVLLCVLLSGLFTLLQRKTKFANLSHAVQQGIIGVAFGLFAIFSTECGVDVGEGAIMNIRDAAPLCSGLIFGTASGFISGLIGSVYRWMCVFWGGGELTRVACSVTTFLVGIFSGIMRHQLFDGKRPGVFSAFCLGATTEVLHMLLMITTNLNRVLSVFPLVQSLALPMALCCGLALGLSTLVNALPDLIANRKQPRLKEKHISYDFGFGLLVCIAIAFIVTSTLTWQIIFRITTEDADLYRHVTLYLVGFSEILIYTTLYILVFQMLRKKVVRNLQRVNDGLNAITNGNLDTVVDVRSYQEFSELSDDVNATVSALKQCIQEAEERIDRELEFARHIQHSALPSVFPPYPNRPDFDLYASMDAAKEVGGDFYDFYMLNHFTMVFLIADVSGKGIPAAMFMMTAKTLIKGLAESGKDVDEIFTEANRKLCASNDAGMFITAWIGKLDFRTGNLEFANAGHNPPLLRRRTGKFEYLRTKPNFILAGMDETRYRKQTLKLEPGDMLFLYTDGVTEAANRSEALYGEERLENCLNALGTDPKEICEKVRADVSAYADGAPQSDDITMLCLKMNAIHDKTMLTTFPDLASCHTVEVFLDDRLRTAGVPAKVMNRMQVATDEIWSNIVRHSGADTATIHLSREGDTLFLTFRDNGKLFDPTSTKAPDTTLSAEEREIGGLGLHMVRKMTTHMWYSRDNDCNVLMLGFAMK